VEHLDDDARRALGRLSRTLGSERELLDRLVANLRWKRMLGTTGPVSWSRHAAREVEAALEELHHLELERAVYAAEANECIGLPDVTLGVLARRAPSPWGPLFGEHRRALLASARELTGHDNAATVEARAGGVGAGGASGVGAGGVGAGAAAAAPAGRILPPSLLDFVR
jgi:hypothetical protein